jgi:hypothetical protein
MLWSSDYVVYLFHKLKFLLCSRSALTNRLRQSLLIGRLRYFQHSLIDMRSAIETEMSCSNDVLVITRTILVRGSGTVKLKNFDVFTITLL